MIIKSLPSNRWLLAAAAADFAVAALHIGIVLMGPSGYLYYGAADLARLAAQGSNAPAILTLLLALVFAVFGVYALSEMGWGRRLPLSTAVVFGIATLYTLRGLILILDLLRLAAGAEYPIRQSVFSAAALVIGMIHFSGWILGWRLRSGAK